MAKQKDNWHESYREKPFTLGVSNQLRYLSWKRAELIKERRARFTKRDELLAKLYKPDPGDKDQTGKLKVQHSDVVRDIEDLATSIKWHDDEFENVVNHADDANLYPDDGAVPTPPKEIFAPKEKPEPKPEKKGDKADGRDPAKDDDKETGHLHGDAGGKPQQPVGVPDDKPPAAPARKPLEGRAVDSGGRPKKKAGK